MTHALTHFLNPQSVAIIGVSPNPSFINAILHNLLRWQYDKPIYPVNPNYRDIAGLQTYPRISDVPEAVDLAVVSVPSRLMPDILQQCEAKGVHALNILTSGFEEITGPEGVRRHGLLTDFVQAYRDAHRGPQLFWQLECAAQLPWHGGIVSDHATRQVVAGISEWRSGAQYGAGLRGSAYWYGTRYQLGQ